MKNKWTILFILIFSLNNCSILFTSLPDKTQVENRLAQFPKKNLPLMGTATIYWNKYQIPFIEAEKDEDLPYLIGLVHAHLRLGQMELFRIISQGRLSEFAGPSTKDIDHSLRIINFGYSVNDMIKIMPPKTKDWLVAYVKGINDYQDQMKEVPHEFKILNIKKTKWTIQDVLRIGRLFSTDVNWLNWFSLSNLMSNPSYSQLISTLTKLGRQSIPSFNNESHSDQYQLLANILSGWSKSGSNSMAISPRFTELKSSILANDPHLGIMQPNIWIIVGYRSPSFHSLGLMLPGIPCVLVGRNKNIAWGGTNMRSLSSALYDVSSLPEESLKTEIQTIKVRWLSDSDRIVRWSPYGPLISDSPLINFPDNKKVALKWMGHQPSDEITTFLKVNQAKNWNEFKQAFASYAVSGQNFLYADNKGNIGQVLAVKLPYKKRKDANVILHDISNPDHQWTNYLNTLKLPSAYNPKEGFLFSSNNLPVKTEYVIGNSFSPNDRIQRGKQLIQSLKPLNLHKVKSVQQDIYSIQSMQLKEYLVEQINEHNLMSILQKKNKNLLNSFVNWDGQYAVDSKGALAFQLIIYHLVKHYYTEKYNEQAMKYLIGRSDIMTIIIEDLQTDENQKRISSLIENSFDLSVSVFEEYKTWGKVHRYKIAHLFSNLPLVGGRYEIDDIPAAGFSTTITKSNARLTDEKHYTRYGANARHISILNEPNENYFVLLGGQDGWLNSYNMTDQVSHWVQGEYIKIPLLIEEVQKTFPFKMELN